MTPLDSDDEELGLEEAQFTNQFLLTGNLVDSARGTIVPSDAPAADARSMALKALEDNSVRAYVIDGMEEAGITRRRIFETLNGALDAKNYGLHQATGNAVELGEDNQSRIGAAKLLMQAMGLVGGGVKQEREDKAPAAPPVIIVNFNNSPLESDDDEDVIDGDRDYSVR